MEGWGRGNECKYNFGEETSWETTASKTKEEIWDNIKKGLRKIECADIKWLEPAPIADFGTNIVQRLSFAEHRLSLLVTLLLHEWNECFYYICTMFLQQSVTPNAELFHLNES